MKGETTLPCDRIINIDTIINNKIMGKSHQLFLTFIKSQSSNKIDLFFITITNYYYLNIL